MTTPIDGIGHVFRDVTMTQKILLEEKSLSKNILPYSLVWM